MTLFEVVTFLHAITKQKNMKVSKQYSNKNNIIKENLIFITVKNRELTNNANIKNYK